MRKTASFILAALLVTVASPGRIDAEENWIRLSQTGNQHHFVDPAGKPFLALGVNHIGALGSVRNDGPRIRSEKQWDNYWETKLENQFQNWNLTTLGYGAPASLRKTAPWFATIGIVKIEKHRSNPDPQSSNHYSFPDVFDVQWADQVTERIRRTVGATRNEPLLVGYFWTDTPTWHLHKTRALRGTDWVSEIRKRPPGSAGHDRYAQFLHQRYRGKLDELNSIYGLQLESLDELVTCSFDSLPIGRHRVHEDDQRFLAMIAKRFYQVVGSAQRQADPHHLVFGDRYLAGDAPESVLNAAAPWIDAVAVQPGDRYSPLYPPSTAFPKTEIEHLHNETKKPVLICDHAISFPTADHPRTIFEQMPDESSAIAATQQFLQDAFAEPYVIGYLRCQYIDRPAGYGRGLRQGLLKANGQPRDGLVNAYRMGFAAATEKLR